MKLRALCLALAIPFTIGVQTAHAEASLAIQQMAEILLKMDKTPTPQQHETLQNLAKTAASANEQRLAKGMLDINGTLTDEGKQQVWAVMRQISATDGERELAKIINHFQDKASSSDQQRLNALLPQQAKADHSSDKKSDKAEKKGDKATKK